MNSWNLALTNLPFDADPAIILLQYIKDSYNITNPLKDEVRFDTKFARLDKPYSIIIEMMLETNKPMVLGNSMRTYDDVRRVQIWCSRKGSKEAAFQIQQMLDNIINANPTALQTRGIKTIFLEEFHDIPFQTGNDKTPEIEDSDVTRRWALVRLKYDKILV